MISTVPGVTKDQFLSVLATVGAIPGHQRHPEETMIPYSNTARISGGTWRKTTKLDLVIRPRLGDPERDPDPFEENQNNRVLIGDDPAWAKPAIAEGLWPCTDRPGGRPNNLKDQAVFPGYGLP